jgi:hypothetical protein
MWPVLLLTVFSANPACQCSSTPHEANTASEVTGTALAAASENFDVQCHPGCCDARQLARSCEQWRDHLRDRWLGQQGGAGWSPRCVVVAHARRQTYAVAVGRGGSQSFGSTWIDTKGNQVAARRVDLLMDGAGQLSALGHELTHVVIADAFPGKQPPPWANEGMALLADSAAKQASHARDVTAARRAQTAFHCAELLVLEGYPRNDRIPAFYGQSAALVRLLAEADEPSQFVGFLRLAEKSGYDHALRATYGIAGASELERLSQDGSARKRATASQLAARPPD